MDENQNNAGGQTPPPVNSGSATDQPMGQPADPAQPSSDMGGAAQQKCVTCGNSASGGTCMACGQGEVSCTCTPAAGGGMPPTGGQPSQEGSSPAT